MCSAHGPATLMGSTSLPCTATAPGATAAPRPFSAHRLGLRQVRASPLPPPAAVSAPPPREAWGWGRQAELLGVGEPGSQGPGNPGSLPPNGSRTLWVSVFPPPAPLALPTGSW